jgi:hypothetical protein
MKDAPQKRKPPDGTGGGREASGCFGGQSQNHNTAGRREAQGIAIERNASQRAPTWAPPAGWHAAELLDELLRNKRRK